MNTFVPRTIKIKNKLARDTKDIMTALRLFGEETQNRSYFISRGLEIRKFPETGFRADFYIYAICISGSASISLNGQQMHISRDEFFTAIPSTIVQIHKHSKDFKARILVFERSFLLKNILDAKQLEQLGFFNYQTVVHVSLHKNEVAMILEKLDYIVWRTNRTGIFHQAIMQSLIINLLFETAEIFFKHRNQLARKVLSREEELFSRFVDLANKHFKQEQLMEFYAKKLAISTKYLTQICTKISGKPPTSTLAEFRVAEAKLLLADPTNNISTVSQELRFSDVAAFSKFFKKHCQLSPSTYRQSLQTLTKPRNLDLNCSQ